eukprot:TRINITY_DN30757_c0_g1_i1.p1 TRINITY_DN30757_c0_g1~~TRINITY_DN30757_c0_g1_i1.p1  ORF type:complete len:195 (+),score=32.31 TRINITY_DN30757_c0_g1_i1:42-626(+)
MARANTVTISLERESNQETAATSTEDEIKKPKRENTVFIKSNSLKIEKEEKKEKPAPQIEVKSGDIIKLEGRRRCLVLPDPTRKQRLRWLDRIYRPVEDECPDLVEAEQVEDLPSTLTISNLPSECLTTYLGGSLVELLASKGKFCDIDLTPDPDSGTATCVVKYDSATVPQKIANSLRKGWKGYNVTTQVVET